MKQVPLRWGIAWLLVAASVLNYLDRTALGVASSHIKDELHLNASQYATVISSFLAAYTLSYAFGGILVDRLGTRRSVLITLTWWSAANMAHALVRNMGDLMLFRFLLGLGEAMFYPAAMRAIAEWFQPKDRSKPVGMILAGASLGALLAPVIVGTMMATPGIGWRGAFVATGGLGFLLLPAWLLLFHPPDRHPRITPAERTYVSEGADAAKTRRQWGVRDVLVQPRAWILVVARALTDASWFLLMFWLVLYLQRARGFTDLMVAAYAWIPYATADVGAIFGGWLSARLILRGMPIVTARRRCMLGFASLMVLTLAGFLVPLNAPFLALALFSVATFGHMAWGTNQLTLHSDLFPEERVATIMGITGAAGAIGGIIAGQLMGGLVDRMGTYLPVFITTACLHPLAATIVYCSLRKGGREWETEAADDLSAPRAGQPLGGVE